jgi:phenylacetate-CoA ligase
MSQVYGALFRNVLLPSFERGVRKRPTLDYLAELERSQWLSKDELLARQLGDLRKLLAHAHANVPWYREKMDAIGAEPGDFTRLEDLAKVPILRRKDARDAGDRRKSTAAPFPDVMKSTSGTMGQPLAFGYDANSDFRRTAVKLRGYGWAGYEMGVPSLHYWGATTAKAAPKQRAKVFLDRYLKRETYVNCTLRGEAEMDAAASAIRKTKPRVLVCYTQAGADLARHINAKGLRTWDTIPVLCGAERLFPADREDLEKAFGPAVFETYGCREVMLIATECALHDGLHVSMENLLVEIVVTEDGQERSARPGEIGEVVITDLHNYGMPFLRYANGDLATQGDGKKCACGRSLERIGPIEGRVTETLRDGSGARVSGLVFNVMFASALAAQVREFQAVQHKDGSITLRLVQTKPLDEAALSLIRSTCKTYLKGVEVKTEVVAEIPLTKGGKRQPVVVE